MSDPRVLSDIGEKGWLSLLQGVLSDSNQNLVVPIGDDAVVREVGGVCEILTSDALVEGTHFRRDWIDWSGLPCRAISSAASDVSAMGGVPVGFLLSVGLPSETHVADLELFAQSVESLCQSTGMKCLGGDTVRSERIFVDVTVIGQVEKNRILRQTGCQSGDALWVTGYLGSSRAGWLALENDSEPPRPIVDRFWFPPHRWNLIEGIHAAFPIRAATDLSDGLARDLEKILAGGDHGAKIQQGSLPLEPEIRKYCGEKGIDPGENAFLGGEDFELLIVEEGNSNRESPVEIDGVPLTRIGQVTSEAGTIRRQQDGKDLANLLDGFDHFG